MEARDDAASEDKAASADHDPREDPPSPPLGRVLLGTQGWNYPAWVGPFFPPGIRPESFLEVYARAFDIVEVDSTFYGTPAATTVRGWFQRTPDHFRFTLKLPQEITHEARLRGAERQTGDFLERARILGKKLAAVLVQLGPDFGPDELPTLTRFLAGLPGDISFAVEFRQRAWIRRDVLRLLRDHGVALTLSDGRWIPRGDLLRLAEQPTADFLYVRWMGEDRTITDYTRVHLDRREELVAWADTMRRASARGTDVLGFANNYFSGHAPASIRALQWLVGQQPTLPEELTEQTSLF